MNRVIFMAMQMLEFRRSGSDRRRPALSRQSFYVASFVAKQTRRTPKGRPSNMHPGDYRAAVRRSFPDHSIFDIFDRRSLAAGLNRCSAPCGVIPPTASPTCRQLAPWLRAAIADS
jgi:hypothetical protein